MEQEVQQQIDPPSSRLKLFNGLVEKGLYTGSQEEFNTQFSNPESIGRLYQGMIDKGLYTKSQDEFNAQFFGDLKKKDSSLPPGVVGPEQSSPLSFEGITQPPPTQTNPEQIVIDPPGPLGKLGADVGAEPVLTGDQLQQNNTEQLKKLSGEERKSDVLESLVQTVYSGIADQIPKEYYTQRLRMSKGNFGDLFDPRSDLNAFGDKLPEAINRDEFNRWNNSLNSEDRGKSYDEKAKMFLTEKLGPDEYNKFVDQFKEQNTKERLGFEKNIQQQNKEAAFHTQGVVQDLKDVHGAGDFLSFAGNMVGQALYRAPISIATGTTGSIIAESAAVYDRQLDLIAEKEGISREEVIKKGLDKPAEGQALAVALGVIDAVSAGSLVGLFRKAAGKELSKNAVKEFAKGFAKGAVTEGVTEGLQTEGEEYAASKGAGVDYKPDAWRIATSTVGGAIGGGGLSSLSPSPSPGVKTSIPTEDQQAIAPEGDLVNTATEQESEVDQKSGNIIPTVQQSKAISTDLSLDGIKESLVKANKIVTDDKGEVTEVKQNSGEKSQLYQDLKEITGDGNAALNEYLKIKQDDGEFKKKFGDWENGIMKEYGRSGNEYSVRIRKSPPKGQDENSFAWTREDNGKLIISFNQNKVKRESDFNNVKQSYSEQNVKGEEYKNLFDKNINKLRDLKLHLIHLALLEKMKGKVTEQDKIESLKEIKRLNEVPLAKDYYGEPMIFMHGGEEGINRFKKPGEKGYSANDMMTGGAGIYFSRSPKGAKFYSGFGEGGPAKGKDIYYTLLKTKNPYYVTDPRAQADYKLENQTSETISKKDVEELKKRGYDSIIWDKEGTPKREAIVFDPDQVEIIGSYRKGLNNTPEIAAGEQSATSSTKINQENGQETNRQGRQEGLLTKSGTGEEGDKKPSLKNDIDKQSSPVPSIEEYKPSVSNETDQQANERVEGSDKVSDKTTTDSTPPGSDKQATGENEGKEVRKKSVLNRAYEGTTKEDVKKSIEKHGLTYEVEHHEDADKAAQAFIDEVGVENAIDAVRTDKVKGGAAAFVWAKAIDDIDAKLTTATDQEEINKLNDLQAQLVEEFGVKAKEGGQFNSALQNIYINSDFEYKLSSQVEKYKAANDGIIPPEVEAKFKELDNQIKEANKRIKELEAKKSPDALIEAIKKAEQKKRVKLITAEKRSDIASFFDSLKVEGVKKNTANASIIPGITLLPEVWNGSIEVIKRAVLAGVDVANAVQAGIDYIKSKDKAFQDDDKFREHMTPLVDKITPKEKSVDKKVEIKDGKVVIPSEVIRQYVREGVNSIDELTDKIHAQISETRHDISKRDVRDAITNYGKTLNMSQEEIDVKLREIKRVGRLLSALEDVQKKIRPLRSGLQRDQLTNEERRLQREVKEGLKGIPVDEAEQEKAWKTALDGVKSRLKNQISDLENQIKTGEKTPKKKGIEYDAEANALKEQVETLRGIIADIEGKPEMSDEQRVKMAISAAEKGAQEYERRIKEKDFAPLQKRETPETPELKKAREERDRLKKEYDDLKKTNPALQEERDKKAQAASLRATEKRIAELEAKIAKGDLEYSKRQSAVELTPQLAAAKERLSDLEKTISDLREASGVAEKKRLDNAKKATQNSIDEYKRRLREEEFTKKDKKEIIADDELLNLRAKKQQAKEAFDRAQYQNELKNRTKSQKVIDALIELWGLTRALRATGEFSFLLLQGGVQTIAHPKNAARSFVTAMKHFASEQRQEEWYAKIRVQDWYSRAKASKLAITETDHKLNSREEMFIAGWVNHIWDILGYPTKLIGKGFYEGWKKANPFKAVERAGTSYLNTLRIARYLDGEEMLRLQNKSYRTHPEDYKNVADVINTFTGRASLGSLERISKPLSVIFFSPKNWASVMKQTTPYAFYYFGKMGSKGDAWYKPSVAQKIALGDYMKYVGLTGSILAMVLAMQDEDDEDRWTMETDPLSSDFLKLKKGDTRVDPWGGRVQMIVLQARLLMGAMKGGHEHVYPLGTPYKAPTRTELVLKMVQNKLAPSTALLVKYLNSRTQEINGKKVQVDQYGNPLPFEEEIVNNLYPIYWETIKELYNDQPETLATFISFMAFLCVGTQSYVGSIPPENRTFTDFYKYMKKQYESEKDPIKKAMLKEQLDDFIKDAKEIYNSEGYYKYQEIKDQAKQMEKQGSEINK